ncbi:1-aminocyclopropane-1-carboxylate deaminase/D-cysteine desulfhydrase, PLP-dependent ACC family [Streptomyces sp. TLI_053]|uniref:1-aminocyclopropane-1-carboxylate deaminase/D-cysteine desulfhydrase n=1 Tax=Streptomyces sp. TLI_053 TaxID=1855352 RepID=UPI00087ADEE3|nr:pyridoxal-phosphate dependent enzyme [Streptomyces sp. TLI_053]SDT77059.1 1-aminocyclopropane-1-carboxylate deaminase/D-cysteine desulfhydrase, PLP-dependent ACC family [Streptomyces sp. TLI_053]
MLEPALLPTPLADCTDETLARAGVELRLKRDDLAHPLVPGNKWRKLAPNLAAAVEGGHRRLVTFGGAYSTHLRAVAVAAAALGLESVGLVRGEELAGRPRNWSLRAAEAAGMELVFLTRAEYREAAGRAGEGPGWRWGPGLVLPEGGSNGLAVTGAAEIVAELDDLGGRDVVCCPVGTGGTLAGIAAGLPRGARALGVAVLRGGEGYLEAEVTRLHREAYGREFDGWRIDHGHHGGGYGRVPAELEEFAAGFERRHGIALERRYVAKLLAAVHDLAGAGAFPPGTRLTAVVTGLPDPVGP